MECQHGVVGCVPGTEMLIVFASDLWFSLVSDYLHKKECLVFLFFQHWNSGYVWHWICFKKLEIVSGNEITYIKMLVVSCIWLWTLWIIDMMLFVSSTGLISKDVGWSGS